MAAHPARAIEWKPKKCVDGERRHARSDDPETALGLQLASIVARLEVDVLVVADLDGAAVASAGEEHEAIALAQLAAALIKELPMRRSVTTTRGFVHVDLVEARGRTWVLAAFARSGVPAPIGIARAVAGASRILRDGLPVVEAPLRLSVRGGGGHREGAAESAEAPAAAERSAFS